MCDNPVDSSQHIADLTVTQIVQNSDIDETRVRSNTSETSCAVNIIGPAGGSARDVRAVAISVGVWHAAQAQQVQQAVDDVDQSNFELELRQICVRRNDIGRGGYS